jgi:pyoverdine/dityrosine biosynthesis protein Dit1
MERNSDKLFEEIKTSFLSQLPKFEKIDKEQSINITYFFSRFSGKKPDEIYTKKEDFLNFSQKVGRALDERNLDFIIPGFAFGSQNTDKVFHEKPDLGEYLSLLSLQYLAKTLYEETGCKTVVRIMADQYFTDVLGVDPKVAENYGAKMKALCETLEGYVIYDDELAKNVSKNIQSALNPLQEPRRYKKYLNKIIQEKIKVVQEQRETKKLLEITGKQLQSEKDTLNENIFRKFLPFYTGECVRLPEEQDTDFNNRVGLVVVRQEVGKAIFNKALIEQHSKAIRLSIHPGGEMSEKAYIKMIPGCKVSAPHNELLVTQTGESYTFELMHYEKISKTMEAEHQIIFINGVPLSFYFQS